VLDISQSPIGFCLRRILHHGREYLVSRIFFAQLGSKNRVSCAFFPKIMRLFHALSAFSNASVEGYKLKEIFFRVAKQNSRNVRRMRSISFR
jgi:hypothetical protein